MKDYIENRVMETAKFFLETQSNIRETAKKYNVSKSTTHKDLTERLHELNPQVFYQVKEVLNEHFEIKHIHGGLATQKKYMH